MSKSWNKNIKSPTPPSSIIDDKLVSAEKKEKVYPSVKNRITSKVFKHTDDTVNELKDKNRYPKIEIYEKAVNLYRMIDDYIPEYSNLSKEKVIKDLLEEYSKRGE